MKKDHLPFFGVGLIYSTLIVLTTVISIICSRKIRILHFGQLSIIALPFILFGIILVFIGVIMIILAIGVSRVHKGIEENRLVTTGIYAYVRNPIYSGFFMICTGAIFINTNVVLLVLPVVYWMFLTVLMKGTEERWLRERFGDEYDAYCDKVNRCIPWFPEEADTKQHEYRRTLGLVFAGLIVSLVLIFIFTRSITTLSAEMTYDATLSVKQNMLKENVENLVGFMDACLDDFCERNPEASDEEEDKSVKDVLARADEALYRAKDAGRDNWKI